MQRVANRLKGCGETNYPIRPRPVRRFHSRAALWLVPILAGGCGFLEDLPPQPPIDSLRPETYLSVLSQAVIYARVDSTVCEDSSATAECDTVWSYYFEADSSRPDEGLDTLGNALQTVLASQQTLHWWGEDPDGEVIGYYYRWNTDPDWTYTTEESREFVVPIRRPFDLFTFAVKAVDQDSLEDLTPATITLPVHNATPEIAFRFKSNPIVPDPSAVYRTFPTRTFAWDITDADGLETVDSVYYALDGTSAASWQALDAAIQSTVTLTDLEPGTHTFYLKARDVAGAESPVIQFPDSTDENAPNTWEVLPVVGEVVIVDDYHQDTGNGALRWYESIFDTIPGVGAGNYSVWEIGPELPFSETDVSATLGYFRHVFWFSGYTGTVTYEGASNAIHRFALNGGNVMINVREILDTSFVWFPLSSTAAINPTGRLGPGKLLISQITPDLDLVSSTLLPVRIRSFEILDDGLFNPEDGPDYQDLYRLQAPQAGDSWTGEPPVAGEYDHRSPLTPGAGKVVFFSFPMHNGRIPLLDDNGSAGKFISWVFQERFLP